MSKMTKAELEARVEDLQDKLETAHSVIADALGYEESDEDEADHDESEED